MTGRESDRPERVLELAETLGRQDCFLFFRHDGHFCDPRVPAQWLRLRRGESLRDPSVVAVVEELAARLPALAPGIYAPVPIARGVAAGLRLDHAIGQHRYEMIVVDDDQRWWWLGRPVAERLRSFFLEHLGWEPAVERFFFEYRVGPGFWDKAYLRHRVTPLVARTLVSVDGRWLADTNAGRRVAIDEGSFRLDRKERLYVTSRSLGELMAADSLRFRLLASVSEDLQSIRLGEEPVPLHWPSDSSVPEIGG